GLEPDDLKDEIARLVDIVIVGDLGAETPAVASAVGAWFVLTVEIALGFEPRDRVARLGEPALRLDEIERAAADLLLVIVPRAFFEIDRERPVMPEPKLGLRRHAQIRLAKEKPGEWLDQSEKIIVHRRWLSIAIARDGGRARQGRGRRGR